MPTDLQTSFIPKAPLNQKVAPSRGGGVGIVTLSAFVLLLLSGLAFGSLFAYNLYLTREIGTPNDDSCAQDADNRCSLQASLKRIEGKVRADLISEIKMTGERIMLAEQLLERRTVLTPLFSRLEDLTIPSVQFTSFEYQEGEDLSLRGVARDYESIALQSDVFVQNPEVVQSAEFSNFTVTEEGDVEFDLAIVLAMGTPQTTVESVPPLDPSLTTPEL